MVFMIAQSESNSAMSSLESSLEPTKMKAKEIDPTATDASPSRTADRPRAELEPGVRALGARRLRSFTEPSVTAAAPAPQGRSPTAGPCEH